MLNERCVEIGKYIIKNRCTIRKAASVFGISKSSVFQDVSKRLKYVDQSLYFEVREVLEYNESVKHIRGGEATKKKYKINQ